MPNVRSLEKIAQVPLLATFQDPSTSKLVLVTTSLGGVPTAVEIDLVFLEHTATNGDVRSFVGTVGGVLWQIDLTGTGAEMTGAAATSG